MWQYYQFFFLNGSFREVELAWRDFQCSILVTTTKIQENKNKPKHEDEIGRTNLLNLHDVDVISKVVDAKPFCDFFPHLK